MSTHEEPVSQVQIWLKDKQADPLSFKSRIMMETAFSLIVDKFIEAERKHNWKDAWDTPEGLNEATCQRMLLEHLAKGDPRDIAVFCCFMIDKGWKTVACADEGRLMALMSEEYDQAPWPSGVRDSPGHRVGFYAKKRAYLDQLLLG